MRRSASGSVFFRQQTGLDCAEHSYGGGCLCQRYPATWHNRCVFLDRLTGQFVTDVRTASRTSLMNLETLEWDLSLCDLFGVPMATLPKIVSTTGDFDTLQTQHGHIPVTTSVVDQQAALYDFGCRKAGDAKITFGTGSFA